MSAAQTFLLNVSESEEKVLKLNIYQENLEDVCGADILQNSAYNMHMFASI